MKAVVLVGGFGTRLRPLTATTPKQMLPVVDRPMIEYVVSTLRRAGVSEVILALGYKEDHFRAAYPDTECAGVPLTYAVEPEPLDTAGAVRFAAEAAGLDETFIVLNGDVLTDIDIGSLWARHHEAGAMATIALTRVEDPSRFGVVPTDAEGAVLGFIEKPNRDEAPTRWINAGIYVLEPEVLQRIAGGRRVSIEREVFPSIVAERGLWAVHCDAYWIDIGTPATYVQAQLDLIDGVWGTGLLAGSPEEGAGLLAGLPEEGVGLLAGVPEEGVGLLAGLPEEGVGLLAESPEASVDGDAEVDRSVVMAGATVAAGAVVRDSIIMAGAEVAADALVDGSIIGPRARVGEGAKVTGLSILGEGQQVGAGQLVDGSKIPMSD
ncbi:MAG: NDP-sugar synthase [Acidimicrobiaceae bacterium]|nr:NDP-sugar synthase [Acidimicrobiaceae bacterium]